MLCSLSESKHASRLMHAFITDRLPRMAQRIAIPHRDIPIFSHNPCPVPEYARYQIPDSMPEL
jgi:hypothetical protein